MRDVKLQSMKNKSDHSCRFFHHAKFHCIIATLNKLFKIEFERGETGKELTFCLIKTIFHKAFHSLRRCSSVSGPLGCPVSSKRQVSPR